MPSTLPVSRLKFTLLHLVGLIALSIHGVVNNLPMALAISLPFAIALVPLGMLVIFDPEQRVRYRAACLTSALVAALFACLIAFLIYFLYAWAAMMRGMG